MQKKKVVTTQTLKQILDSINSVEEHNIFMNESFDNPQIQQLISNFNLIKEMKEIDLKIGMELTRLDILRVEKPDWASHIEKLTLDEFLDQI